MWLITLCLISKPYLCQDQIRYGLYMTREECIARAAYSDVKKRISKYKGKVEYKCLEIPSKML